MSEKLPEIRTPESITHWLHELARVNGTSFAAEYRNYHTESE